MVDKEGSKRTPFICERSITTPSSQVARPAPLWPPPRTATRKSFSRANATARRTSAALTLFTSFRVSQKKVAIKCRHQPASNIGNSANRFSDQPCSWRNCSESSPDPYFNSELLTVTRISRNRHRCSRLVIEVGAQPTLYLFKRHPLPMLVVQYLIPTDFSHTEVFRFRMPDIKSAHRASGPHRETFG